MRAIEGQGTNLAPLKPDLDTPCFLAPLSLLREIVRTKNPVKAEIRERCSSERTTTIHPTRANPALAFNLSSSNLKSTRAADHAEAPLAAADPGADLADVFAFLDPNDNSKVTLAMDVEGFIVPSELLNLSFFAPVVVYRFEIENTGDAKADRTIDIIFSRQTSRSQPQMPVSAKEKT
ncbi:MAG: DUF4331 family protein [Pyrinomonadaceae bacterium]